MPFFVMFLYGAAGWIFLQITYSHGNVSITIPLVAVTQRLVSMFSGYYVYGEHFSAMKIIGILVILEIHGFPMYFLQKYDHGLPWYMEFIWTRARGGFVFCQFIFRFKLKTFHMHTHMIRAMLKLCFSIGT